VAVGAGRAESFFDTAGGLLGLFGREALAEDAQVEIDSRAGFRGVTLVVNLESRELVDEAFERVRLAGGRIVKEPEATDWGGYSGYFADPDHLWKVAFNPSWPIVDGRPRLPNESGLARPGEPTQSTSTEGSRLLQERFGDLP
jgi:uncharacterized protein